MKPVYYFLLIILCCIQLTSCSNERDGEKPIARVGDMYLYPADIEGLVMEGTSKNDSILLVKNFISDWIHKQVLVTRALENVDIDKRELDKKVNDYKESIYIYQYENELIKQKLDTVVTEQQMDEFFNKHKDDFVLKNDVVRLTYIKIANTQPDLVNLKRMYVDPSINILQLQDVCKKSADLFSLDESNWATADIFPINMQNQFINARGFIENKDSVYTYIANVKEYLAKGNTSPKNYVKDQIIKIIISQRKVQMVQQLREDLYKEAFQKGDVEVL